MSPREKKASGLGTLVFTILALAFTALSAYLLAMLLSETQYVQEPLKPVVAAKGTIDPLQPITEENLKVLQLPESTIPDGAVATIDELVTTPPQRSLLRLYDGELIFKERLADAFAGRSLAARIPKGMRAMVVKLDMAASQAGIIYPNAIVDVVATVRLPRKSTTVTQTIVQQVAVLGVGQDVDPTERRKKEQDTGEKYAGKTDYEELAVVLLVDTVQAERITLASREGIVDLILRNQTDKEEPETVGVEPRDLFPSLEEEEEEEGSGSRRRDTVRRILRRSRSRRAEPEEPPTVQVQ